MEQEEFFFFLHKSNQNVTDAMKKKGFLFDLMELNFEMEAAEIHC